MEVHEEHLMVPEGVEVYEINGPYFFGIATKFEEIMSELGDRPKVRIIRMRKVPFIDSTGIHNLTNLCEMSKKENIHIVLSTLQGQPAAVDAVKYAGFNVCTLANNHILDQGTKCCIETRELLENAGIKTVGIGKNSAEAATVLYINQKEKGTLAIVNCCEHEFSIATATTAGANPLNPIQQYYNIQEARTKADYVLVIVHGGHEHYALPSPRMKETYRFFIDAGADAIINHHQHCYSGYEIYHGKPIFYGLGNLLFDHKSERHGPWNEGFMVSLRLDKQTLPQFELYPYTQCNERPSVIPMNEAERKIFAERIDKLNQIISNEDQLNTTFETWAQKTSRNFLVPFQPYCTRTAKRLFVHGLLPSFITRKKRYQILNYLNCEAHLDKLRTVVSKLK